MSVVSVAEAKARFAELVHQAERGQPVRITRRGRAVAVLVSEADFALLNGRRAGLLAYTDGWRAKAAQDGLSLADDAVWHGLRNRDDRRPPDLG